MRLACVSSVLLLLVAGTGVLPARADVAPLPGDGPGVAISPPPVPQDFLAEGRRLYLAGNFAGAAIAWERAVAADSRSSAGFLALGLVSLKLGRGQASVAAFQAAQRLDPADPLVAYHLGIAYQATGDQAAAKKAYALALQLDPGHVAARENLAVLATGAATPAPVSSSWSTPVPYVPPARKPSPAPAATPTPAQPASGQPVSMVLRRAEARLGRGDRAGALAALRDGVAGHPEDAALWRALGGLFALQGDVLAAEALLRKAVGLAPTDPAGPLALAPVLARTGRPAEADAQLKEAARMGASPAQLSAARAAVARERRSLP